MPALTLEQLNSPDFRELCDMLRYKRPHGSKSERKFINRFIRPLGVQTDGYGNLHKTIANADGSRPSVLFSCHTDTVHRTSGKQRLGLFEDTGTLCLGTGETECLGADNAVGVWIMLGLIRAGVPGVYMFHRNEERGRVGSEWIAEHEPERLEGIDFAIAFDRRGVSEIITEQICGVTCSKTFASQLAGLLGMDHRPSDNGIYTDTASYADRVAECTNIAAGYNMEHSSKETLNVPYAMQLRDACIALDWSKLTAVRDPNDPDNVPWWSRPSSYGSGNAYGHSGYYGDDGYGDNDWMPGKLSLEELVRDYPSAVATVLKQYGFQADMLHDEIEEVIGLGPRHRGVRCS